LAQDLLAIGQRDEAATLLREGVEAVKEVADHETIKASTLETSIELNLVLGRMLEEDGLPNQAEDHYRRANSSLDELKSETTDAYFRDLFECRLALADLLKRSQRSPDEAREIYLAYANVLQTVTKKHPQSPSAPAALSRFYANCLDGSLRDYQRALEYAEKALELAPQYPNSQIAFALTSVRLEQWNDAIKHLNLAMEYGGPDAVKMYLMAMAQHQAGNASEAESWFSKAEEWLIRHNSKDLRARQFQAEAKAVLPN
jgi:tetratricopeptide (TPR) repeat protein